MRANDHATKSKVENDALALGGDTRLDAVRRRAGADGRGHTDVKVDSETISGLGARNIGSAAMSGRVAALDAVQEGQRLTIYVGAASGGVWKSVNGGTTFKPVFDKQPVQSIGAVTIDPKNPKIDLGRHRRIVDAQQRLDRRRRLQVHRRRRELDQRRLEGVRAHRQDSGRSERLEHGLRLRAGQALERQRRARRLQDHRRRQDLGEDSEGRERFDRLLDDLDGPAEPEDDLRRHVGFPPQRLDVPLRRRRRRTRRAAAVFSKATDGGATWTELDANNAKGLPAEALGPRGGRGRPVEAERRLCRHRSRMPKNGLYRSDDGGKTWTALDRSQTMIWRPFYFAHLIVDPKDENKIYKPDLPLDRQQRRRQELQQHHAAATHGDHHDLWINPDEHRSPDRGRRRRRLVLLRRRQPLVEG